MDDFSELTGETLESAWRRHDLMTVLSRDIAELEASIERDERILRELRLRLAALENHRYSYGDHKHD